MPKILFNKNTNEFKPYPRNDEEPIIGLDTSIYDIYEKIELDAPSYDPDTEKLIQVASIDNANKTLTQSYTAVALTPEELQVKYEASLNWEAFAFEMFDGDQGAASPYAQLITWGTQSNIFVILLSQLTAAVLSVKNEPRLKILFTRLKQTLASSQELDFTTEQITELNRLFGVLNVNWLWEDL